jgi:pyruvate/2-oxoglutarate dehydrogenase complex dihydrolipoamide acyltransferase (E2) component
MIQNIIMPQLGETVAEGKILAWFKSVGDEIKEGDNLFEVETDKVSLEVPAIVAGRLDEIRVGVGVVAKVGEVLAVVGDGAAEPAAPKAAPVAAVTTPLDRFGPAEASDGVRITPLARRLIAENGLETAVLAAEAARRGETRITEKEVRAALDARAPAPAAVAQADGEVVTLNTMRRRTGERLAENWRTIPHVFQAVEVDFTALNRARQRRKAAFLAEHGFSLTYLPFIARATALAIEAFPLVNARFVDGALVKSRDVHLGIAVDLSHNGLVAPVVRDAGRLALIGLAQAINRQIAKARAGKLSADDLAGGTYSISNNGAFGATLTTPIINAPQVAILSADAILLKPAVVSTPEGDFVAPRRIGFVGQSFDHRAFDGAYSAAFLSRLKQILEGRDWSDELA